MAGCPRLVVSVLVLAWSGCREPNPYHCPDGIHCGACESAGECQAPTPVCHPDLMACVECLDDTQCAESRPVCNADSACVECFEDAHCASGLCFGDSTCADPADVAHISGASAGDNDMCSRDMPCKTLNRALSLAPARRHIKVTGEVVNTALAVIDRRVVVFHGGPGAKITRTGPGLLLSIRNDSNVTVSDLEIAGGPGGDAIELTDAPGPMVSMTRVQVKAPGGHGIRVPVGTIAMTDSQVSNCSMTGVNLTNNGALVMTRSRVFDNASDGVRITNTSAELRGSWIYGNKGTAGVYAMNGATVTIESSVIADNTGQHGGVSITGGSLTIRNSIIARNGGSQSTAGGLYLSSPSVVFEFNTVAGNTALAGSPTGVSCVLSARLGSSILTNPDISLGGLCGPEYSLTATTGTPTGTNRTGDPMFLDVAGGPADPMFFRIGGSSAARDGADPAATLDVDIDGQPRTGARDIGADEVN